MKWTPERLVSQSASDILSGVFQDLSVLSGELSPPATGTISTFKQIFLMLSRRNTNSSAGQSLP